jgi:hypothetical protein
MNCISNKCLILWAICQQSLFSINIQSLTNSFISLSGFPGFPELHSFIFEVKTMKKNFSLSALFVFTMIMSAFFAGNVSAQATAPSLGTAANFSVLAGSTVTNTGPSVVSGDLGVSPGTAVTGFPPGIVTGTIHPGDAVAAQAQSDALIAYNNLAGQACLPANNLTGQDLGGLVLTAGVYCFDSSAQLTGTLTLNAQGDPNAVFIFQIGSTLTTASNSAVMVFNGGSTCNVFFQVGSSATLGTNTSFQGNILALTSITLNTGASVSGRALALNGAVTLDSNSFTTCGILSPTAAMVNVGGRVINASGRGISGALIEMTNGEGVVRRTYTGKFGNYNFADIEVGQILVLEVKAKCYNFTEPTRVVSLNDELTTLDFTGYQLTGRCGR